MSKGIPCRRKKRGLMVAPTQPTEPRRELNVVDAIMDFEGGQLDEDETIALFQRLIDSGMAWTLQGSYGRMASALIDAGLCTKGS